MGVILLYQEPHEYEYLYQSLVLQFECGAFLAGKTFLTQKQICRQYNVGITTVRKVMKMLSQRGYIRTASGQPATVIYQAPRELSISLLVSRRNAISDCYQGMRMMLPALYREGAKLCGDDELKRLQEIIDEINDDMELSALYRQANAFFTKLLEPFHNGLIIDLEIDAENYLRFPYIPVDNVEDPFYQSPRRIKNWLQTAHKMIDEKRFDAFCESVLRIYNDAYQKVDQYLSLLGRHAAEIPLLKKDIPWFRTKRHSELYSRLSMTIVRRILNGEFDGQKYLPSIPRLMEEYGVMKDTASRAVNLLNTLGFTQTIDKKGTVITTKDFRSVRGHVDFGDSVIRERLTLFLEALQILALTTRNCTAMFPAVSEEWVRRLAKNPYRIEENQIGSQSIQVLMNYLIYSAPCNSLQNIYRQLNEILLWGNYLMSVEEELYSSDWGEISETVSEILTALRKNERTVLPELFESFFLQVYQSIYAVVVQLPFDEEDLPLFLTLL